VLPLHRRRRYPGSLAATDGRRNYHGPWTETTLYTFLLKSNGPYPDAPLTWNARRQAFLAQRLRAVVRQGPCTRLRRSIRSEVCQGRSSPAALLLEVFRNYAAYTATVKEVSVRVTGR
jgi:hypothetical protein